jgi:hypothetical protein
MNVKKNTHTPEGNNSEMQVSYMYHVTDKLFIT